MNSRLVCFVLPICLVTGCAARPYRVSGLTAIAYAEGESANSNSMSSSQVSAFLTKYLLGVRSKLPGDVAQQRVWKVGEGDGGVINDYVEGMQQARDANPKTRVSRFVANAISPVIADPDAYQVWKPPGVEMQFIGYDNEVTAILIKSPDKGRVFFVPAPTAASVLSGFFCIGRPTGEVGYKSCGTCGADLISQPFEKANGDVFFAPNETEDQRKKHVEVGQPRHMGGQPLNTDCDIHNKKAGDVCEEKPGNVGPASN